MGAKSIMNKRGFEWNIATLIMVLVTLALILSFFWGIKGWLGSWMGDFIARGGR